MNHMIILEYLKSFFFRYILPPILFILIRLILSQVYLLWLQCHFFLICLWANPINQWVQLRITTFLSCNGGRGGVMVSLSHFLSPSTSHLSLSLSHSLSLSLSLQKFPFYGKPMDVFVLVLLRLTNNMFIYLSADAIMSDRPPLTHANSSQV